MMRVCHNYVGDSSKLSKWPNLNKESTDDDCNGLEPHEKLSQYPCVYADLKK